jgi:hypothetical protein
VGRRVHLRKDTDDKSEFRCAGGIGIVREGWVNRKGEVVRYNLAFLLPHLSRIDNGRVLGFHERHYMGEVKPFLFTGYRATARRFYREVEVLRRSYED